MDKHYLLAPGPTPIPPEILLRMAEPDHSPSCPGIRKDSAGSARRVKISLPDEERSIDLCLFGNGGDGRGRDQYALRR